MIQWVSGPISGLKVSSKDNEIAAQLTKMILKIGRKSVTLNFGLKGCPLDTLKSKIHP